MQLKNLFHGKLITEMWKGQDVLHFFYDAQGRVSMVEWNGEVFSYVHNLQGDIVAIVDSSGAKVVEYRYDAWGKEISRTLTSDIGELNPFRYRGYVYDEETELYYLRSRYYDPEIGRFVNADTYLGGVFLLSLNSFYYCLNDPIQHKDPSGELFVEHSGGGGGAIVYNPHSSALTSDNTGGLFGFLIAVTRFLTDGFTSKVKKEVRKDKETPKEYSIYVLGIKQPPNPKYVGMVKSYRFDQRMREHAWRGLDLLYHQDALTKAQARAM